VVEFMKRSKKPPLHLPLANPSAEEKFMAGFRASAEELSSIPLVDESTVAAWLQQL
jgi:hypothetical protein